MSSNDPTPARAAVAAAESLLNTPSGALRRSEANLRRKCIPPRLAILAALA
jgi:hypothetical protein